MQINMVVYLLSLSWGTALSNSCKTQTHPSSQVPSQAPTPSGYYQSLWPSAAVVAVPGCILVPVLSGWHHAYIVPSFPPLLFASPE